MGEGHGTSATVNLFVDAQDLPLKYPIHYLGLLPQVLRLPVGVVVLDLLVRPPQGGSDLLRVLAGIA